MKESHPIEYAEYAVLQDIADEPTFNWWVPHVLKKKTHIISKVKSKYWSRTHKFGIKVPKTVQDAIKLDQENGDTMWWDAILKEMKNVRVAFELYDGDIQDLIKDKGFTKIDCHIIFDIKMGENF